LRNLKNFCILSVLFYITLMMVPKATETCRWILKYDVAYFIDVHLFV